MTNQKIKELEKLALKARILSVDGIYRAQSGHPGGSLSATDIITYLYFEKLNVNPENPSMSNRDRFVLSKGHSCPALYSVLALKGFFPEHELKDLRQLGAMLQGHPCMNGVPGVDMSTGSLGQGISAACGIALSEKRGNLGFRTYSIIGDGESQEGQVWEAAMFAAHYNLSKLTVYLDFNKLQIDGEVEKVMNPGCLQDKFAAFGWDVYTIDGHSFEQLDDATNKAEKTDKPSVIICETIKGKGVSFMENQAGWHGKAPKKEEYEIAMSELNSLLEAMNK